MTDAGDATTRRERDYSAAEPPACMPSREQTAMTQEHARQASDRDAEARRDAYITSGTDVGGRSRSAASESAPTTMMTPDDPKLRDYNATLKSDPPIQSDPLGNAIIGMAAGGVIGAVRAGVASAALDGVAPEIAKGAALGAAKTAASRTAIAIGSTLAPPPELPASAGQSSTRATSMPVKEPLETDTPRIPELLPPVHIQG